MIEIIKPILLLLIVWLFISNTIQRFKCSKMTETELFLSIPNQLILDYRNCD